MEFQTKEIKTFLNDDEFNLEDRNIRITRNIEIGYDNEVF